LLLKSKSNENPRYVTRYILFWSTARRKHRCSNRSWHYSWANFSSCAILKLIAVTYLISAQLCRCLNLYHTWQLS